MEAEKKGQRANIRKKKTLERAVSTVEYMALIVFFIGALLVFQKYILRAFLGQWKKAGETFGHGRQFDPRDFGSQGTGGGTLRCLFVYNNPDDPTSDSGVWVTLPCYDDCRLAGGSPGTCSSSCRETNYCPGE